MAATQTFNASGIAAGFNLVAAPIVFIASLSQMTNRIVDKLVDKAKELEADWSAEGLQIEIDQIAGTIEITDPNGVIDDGGGSVSGEVYTATLDGKDYVWAAAQGDYLQVLTPDKPKFNYGSLALNALKQSDEKLTMVVDFDSGNLSISNESAESGLFTPDAYTGIDYTPGAVSESTADFWE